MKYHTKIYLMEMGFDKSDFIPCEICGAKAVDIHHIKARGMGGDPKKDHIDNLVALCRRCHAFYGDKKQHMDLFHEIVQNRKK
jgi:HNH endonuclease